ncbi:hypothetical protein PoB_003331100 [Plakobranchus ocellatus]|uniref:Uncharacterized protein n=1 Tax=Plakobranchus ocellatus TaxID=259542 RepID=A0AAV4A6G2_9GAST|nr:hypothetical protein PoB_003331100 [Plakobranchus ocellatus]
MKDPCRSKAAFGIHSSFSDTLSRTDIDDHVSPLKPFLYELNRLFLILLPFAHDLILSLSTSTAFAFNLSGGVVGTVAMESAERSAGTLLSRVRAPPPASWLDKSYSLSTSTAFAFNLSGGGRWHSGYGIRREVCRDPSVAGSSPATGVLA